MKVIEANAIEYDLAVLFLRSMFQLNDFSSIKDDPFPSVLGKSPASYKFQIIKAANQLSDFMKTWTPHKYFNPHKLYADTLETTGKSNFRFKANVWMILQLLVEWSNE